MSQSLVAKLEQLQNKVIALSKEVVELRVEEKKSREQVKALYRENETLRKKVESTQAQVNDMLNEWFPELELTAEGDNGNA